MHRNEPTDLPIHTRRRLLAGFGTAMAGGALVAAAGMVLPMKAKAAGTGAIGMKCVTVLYPNADNIRFDFDYYRDHHLPLIMKLYGKCIARFELRKGLPGPDGAKPPYVATITIYVADEQAFAEAGKQHAETLIKDVPNFSSVQPIFQNDEIYGVAES